MTNWKEILCNCKHRYVYKVRNARNIRYGVFNESLSCFIGLREDFLDTVYLTLEPGYPEKEIEPLPNNIELNLDNSELIDYLLQFEPDLRIIYDYDT